MDNNDFFQTVNSKKSKAKIGFFKGIVIPFTSGVLGASVLLGVCCYVPPVRTAVTDFLGLAQTSTSIENGSQQNNYIAPVANQNLVSLKEYSDTGIYASTKVLPSIVGITVEYTVNSPYFGYSLQSSGTASGSGVIISEDGYILTNNHVVNSASSSSYYQVSKANKVTVKLYNDDTIYDATIIGTDETTDLAVIKIDKTGLPAAELGDSSSVKVGEFSMAIGNPLGMESSVTAGIISAINREITSDGKTFKVIQTDAAINSGNSGGALINSKGQVIGINTLKLSGTNIEGIGFAIPINSTKEIYTQLISDGKVKRPFIGIGGKDIDEATAKRYNLVEGVYVTSIEEFSSAEKSGLKLYDIITKIDGKSIKTVDELNNIKNTHSIGDKVQLTIYRDKEYQEIELTLGEQP